MRYQIQIKYASASNLSLWEDYGSTTANPDGTTVFTPFSTTNIAELQAKLEEVDAAFGYENIRAIAIPEFTVDITVAQENV